MKRSAIIPLITFLLANACTPIDKPEKYPDEEYSVENYTPEIPTDEKRNGAIYCKGSVVISGEGILQVTGKKKHGISVKSSFTMRPGTTVAINDVADNCIKAEGITILGGYLWAKTSAEAGKCLSSDADVTIKGCELKLYTSGNAIYDADENDTSSAAGIKADGNMTVTDGNILCVSSGTGGKGINVDGNFTVDNGTVGSRTVCTMQEQNSVPLHRTASIRL